MLRQPAITQVSIEPRLVRLEDEIDVTSLGWRLVIPKGRLSDLASVPRLAWPIIAPLELSVVAAFVHDEGYKNGGVIRASRSLMLGGETERFTREECDNFLYDIAAQSGVWWWRRALARKIVRWFGAENFKNPPTILLTRRVA